MRRWGVLLAFALVVLTGCDAASSAPTSAPTSDGPDGSSTHQLTVGGLDRSYRMYVPAGLTGPAPLVVFLHGGFGSAESAERSYGWDAQADAGRFVVVYPDGLNRAWNTEGGCCGQSAARGVDDVAFVGAVVQDVQRQVSVDPARVYATGISNGGIMAYTLACRTDLFAAIGPDSATMLADCPSPAPLSVIHIHGTADTRIPYDGGVGEGPASIDGPSIPSVAATWRSVDRCADPTVTVAGDVTTSSATCPDGRAVELITIAGAGHQWPGSTGDRPGADPPSNALNATATIWAFFAAHPR